MGRFITGAPTDRGMIFAPIEADQVYLLITQERNASPHSWTASKLKGSLSANTADCCTIQHDGNVIGYRVVQRVLDEAELLNLVIFKPHQAKGYGQRALKKLCAELQELGVKKLFLEVRETNARAQALYHKTGFSLIAERLNYYPAGEASAGRKQAARVMRRVL